MDQSQFHQDLVESEEAFIDQFNPTSQNYHNGVKVPVPVGGARVPETMPTMYPDTDLKQYLEQKPQEDFGPEYKLVLEQKEFLDSLKKNLNKVTATHESLLRNQEQIKKPNLTPALQEKTQKQLDQEVAALNVQIELLKGAVIQLATQEKFKYNDLPAIIDLSMKQYKTKEELFEFSRLIKGVTQQIFKDNQKLTEEIKQIKKNASQKVQA